MSVQVITLNGESITTRTECDDLRCLFAHEEECVCKCGAEFHRKGWNQGVQADTFRVSKAEILAALTANRVAARAASIAATRKFEAKVEKHVVLSNRAKGQARVGGKFVKAA